MITVGEEKFLWSEMRKVDNRPTKFYKYKAMGEWLNKLLLDNEFYMTPQVMLNDFIDCCYKFSPRLIDEFTESESPTILEEEEFKKRGIKREHINALVRNKNWEGELYLALYHFLPKYITCFTTVDSNEHLWTHYGAGHKGVCLEFDFSAETTIKEMMLPVIYRDFLPVLDSLDDYMGTGFFKRKTYEPENEWRLVTPIPGNFKFSKSSLTGITLGSRVTGKQKDELVLLLEDSGYDLEKIRIHQREFRVDDVVIPMDKEITIAEDGGYTISDTSILTY